MSRINTSKITGKIRIRIIRPWRGYPVGAVIKPPGAMRQILLQAKDQLGNRVAEVVEEEEAPPAAAKPSVERDPGPGEKPDTAQEEGRKGKRAEKAASRDGRAR